MNFRTLKANEINVRVQSCNYNPKTERCCAIYLLYKDARCDMNILDESVGVANWQRNHQVIDGNLYCNVGIKFHDEWIWKQDVGVESNTEAEKGQASDSFKRACFNFGIGRELYTSPLIKIWLTKDEDYYVKNDKAIPTLSLDVATSNLKESLFATSIPKLSQISFVNPSAELHAKILIFSIFSSLYYFYYYLLKNIINAPIIAPLYLEKNSLKFLRSFLL